MSTLGLSDTARRLIADLPPYEQASPTIQRTMDAMSRELDRLEDAVGQVRAEMIPSTSDVVLRAWEALFGLPVESVGKTLAQRRAAVLAYLAALGSSGSGLDWEASMNALIGSGWSYLEYAPPEGRRANLIADPRGTSTANWQSFYSNGAVTLAVENGLVTATTSGSRNNTWTVLRPRDELTGDGPLTPGRYYGVRARLTIAQQLTTNGPFELHLTARNASGVAIGSVLVATSAANSNTYPAGTVLEMSGVALAPVGSAIAGLEVRAVHTGITGAGKVRFDRMLVAEVADAVAEVPQFVSGLTVGHTWSGTADDSVTLRVSPAANVLRIYLPFTAALAAPAQPTGSPSGAGGTTNYWSVTATNFYGETTASPERSTNLPVGGTVTLDWPDVAGATGYRVYRGTSSGTKQLIAQVTASSYVDNGNAPIAPVPPPSTNTTASSQLAAAQRLARQITPANLDLEFVVNAGFIIGVSGMGDAL